VPYVPQTAVKSEFEQTVIRNSWMAEVWLELSRSMIVECPGTSAYASEMSSMYSALAKDCKDAQKQAQGKAKVYRF
jgi:hypothetical protein